MTMPNPAKAPDGYVLVTDGNFQSGDYITV
jgi:hypothetical protein